MEEDLHQAHGITSGITWGKAEKKGTLKRTGLVLTKIRGTKMWYEKANK